MCYNTIVPREEQQQKEDIIMTKEELLNMFKGYEEFVTVQDNEVYVYDFEGFDDEWEEIMVDVPDIVYERASACELMGVIVRFASEDI
jgi:hypothetical protein